MTRLPIALSGLLFFGTFATVYSVGAIILGFSAGLLYAYSKILQDREPNKASLSILPLSARKGHAVSADKK